MHRKLRLAALALVALVAVWYAAVLRTGSVRERKAAWRGERES